MTHSNPVRIVAERIRLRRQALGLTQDELAIKLGISSPSVSRAEREGLSRLETIYSWARVLGCGPGYLSGFVDEIGEPVVGPTEEHQPQGSR